MECFLTSNIFLFSQPRTSLFSVIRLLVFIFHFELFCIASHLNMGSNTSQKQKREVTSQCFCWSQAHRNSLLLQASSLTASRLINPGALVPTSFSSVPTSISAASLSCLAAEHCQIHDQEALDLWRSNALETIEDLYEQKAALLRHEAQMRAVLEQLRAIINEELPRHTTPDDQRVRRIDMPMSHPQEWVIHHCFFFTLLVGNKLKPRQWQEIELVLHVWGWERLLQILQLYLDTNDWSLA